MSIKILPQELINQIAAGEVVERPASVVKELIENSLDAQADSIEIEIQNGGLNLIKVTDNGIGMSQKDAKLSVCQHATSKINCVDDLFKIASLGFRGEALASISAVSEFSLRTKLANELCGIEIKVMDKTIQENEIGCPGGTAVEVKNLFYNIPARKKYLKTAVTEYNHIVDLFINFCLAHSDVSWKLIHNNKTVYHFAKVAELKDRIYEVLGEQVAKNLLTVDYNAVEMKVGGFVGQPQIARNNRKLQYLFVNGRQVNDYIISAKVKDAFGQHIFHNLYPVYILFLQIDSQKVDVNVHPRKMEVRFSEPQKIYSAVYRAVADVLDSAELTKQINNFEKPIKAGQNFGKISNVKYQMPNQSQMLNLKMSNQAIDFNQKIINQAQPDFENNLIQMGGSEMKILGQAADSYIIAETPNSIKIYDQHAVSERVQYQKIKTDYLNSKISRQQLLIPENIELTVNEANLLKNKLSVVEKFGFDLSELGQNSFMVNAVPQILSNKDYQQALRELVGKIIETEDWEIENELNEAVDDILKMISCKSAIKFGDKLNYDEIKALLEAVEKCENKFTCVHGRPNVIEYTYEELEKLFKRTG